MRTLKSLQRGELQAGDAAKAGTGVGRGARTLNSGLAGAGGGSKGGVEQRTAEQRGAKGWDGTGMGEDGARLSTQQDGLAGATQGHSAGSLFGFH